MVFTGPDDLQEGEKEIVAARYREYHTLPERLALYAEALCALCNIQLSRTGVQCGRHVARDDCVEGR
jgi:hypothetical protein